MKHIIRCLILLSECFYLFAYGSEQGVAGIDFKQIESNMQKLRKDVTAIENREKASVIRLKRDPFATLVVPEKQKKIVDEEINSKKDSLILSGIISDGNTFLAIIGDEVKREGETLGDFKIYKIKDEYVLIKYGDEIFSLYIKQ